MNISTTQNAPVYRSPYSADAYPSEEVKQAFIEQYNRDSKKIVAWLRSGPHPARLAEWVRDYYLLGFISPYGLDDQGNYFAPHGMSSYGVPRLRPGDN